MRKKMASTAQPVEVSLAKKARRDFFDKLSQSQTLRLFVQVL